MSISAAQAFLDRIEHDETMAARLAALQNDPDAVLQALREAGFDTDPEEVKTVFLARYGADLSIDQLEAIAAGLDFDIIGASVGALVGFGVLAATAAAL